MTADNDTLTAISGLQVGHWTDAAGATGCTVILAPPDGAVASASFVGPSPGTREGILLAPHKRVPRIHALVLTGGSAFGLSAADGVMNELEARGIGHPTPAGVVPIVPAAVIYDRMVGDPTARPTAESGRAALLAASSAPVPLGRVGAGTGASAGKYLEPVRTGVGSAVVEHGGVRVGALAVVNPVGDVIGPDGRVLAGHGDTTAWRSMTLEFGHTTLVAIGVEAPLDKAGARLIADAGQGALGRAIRPSHTPWDGDAVFVLSTGHAPAAPAALLSTLAQDAACRAVWRATDAGRASDL